MPIKSFVVRTSIVNNREYKKKYAQCVCDNCNLEWEAKRWNKKNNYIFCSYNCCNQSRKKGNFLDLTVRKNNEKKYGCDYPLQNREVYGKRTKKILEKYGVSNIQDTENWKARRKQTIIKRYGREIFQTEEFKEKRVRALIEKYGVDSPIKNIKILQKRRETNAVRYGGGALKSKEILNRMFKTRLERYGYRTSFSSSEVQRKCYIRVHGYSREQYLERLDQYIVYKSEVRRISESQNLSDLEFYNLRGRNTYHLDHIFSISEGFKNNVKPEIIGSIINLRFISAIENRKKTKKCDIKLEELYRRYDELSK